MGQEQYKLEQLSPWRWRVPTGTVPGMQVPGEIFASEEMIASIRNDRTPKQVANVATLPGIIKASLAMPDIHWGYGFPIGGVAAFDVDKGIISPGGVGYDINCGVMLLRSNLEMQSMRKRIPKLVDALFNSIPCGVGSEGKIRLSEKDFPRVLTEGAKWLVDQGLANPSDPEHMEENGALQGGNPELVSKRAKKRATRQLGTLGSGNHFIEIQEVKEIFLPEVAEAFGLHKGQLVLMLHSGSRGLGHQVCDDSLVVMQRAVQKYEFNLPDRQLACAPVKSPEGEDYLSAMKCAANFAWANRLAMAGLARETFKDFLGMSDDKIGLSMVYDVCHNIAKIESFDVNGEKKQLCVHRKGATRALGPNDQRVPAAYRKFGQPVIIPGDMGTASYILVGTDEGKNLSFSSSCHGAGRVLSRKAAIKNSKGKNIAEDLRKRGISVRWRGKTTLMEESPDAYKNISEVVGSVDGAGISRLIAKMSPVGTVKG